MTGGPERLPDREGLLRRAAQLAAKTIIIDVEPLIAWWDTSQESLDQGIRAMLDRIRAMPDVSVVCFATNSCRRPLPGSCQAALRSAVLEEMRWLETSCGSSVESSGW